MLRTFLSLSLALLCLGPSPVGPRASAQLPQKSSAAPVNRADSEQKLALYLQQGSVAVDNIQSAESQLQANIAGLRQLQPRFKDSKDLNDALASLQKLLAEVQQLYQQAVQQNTAFQHAATSAKPDLSAISTQADKLVKLSKQAQADAAQGSTTEQQAVAALAPPAPVKAEAPKHHESVEADARQQQPAGQSSPPPPPPPPPASPGQVATTSDSDKESVWFGKLLNGLLQYHVPTTMQWKVPSTATVQINGEKAPAPGAIEGQTGQATVKVSRRMKVMVSAPDNPEEFLIATEPDTQLVQFVPEDGSTTWNFSVTPRYTAKSQKLVVQVWVLYSANTQQELPVYQAVVDVHVPGAGECLKLLFEGDPDYWLKYGLPGGAGFVFFSGIVTALWRWLAKKRKKPAASPEQAT